MYCTNCGNKLKSTDAFCGICGVKVKAPVAKENPPEKPIEQPAIKEEQPVPKEEPKKEMVIEVEEEKLESKASDTTVIAIVVGTLVTIALLSIILSNII